MKRLLIACVAIATTLSLSALTARAQSADPLSVIKALHAAQAAGQIDAVMALFADDAVLKVVPPPSGSTGIYTGKDMIRAWFQAGFAQHQQADSKNYQASGDHVTWLSTISQDAFRQLGLASLDFTGEAVVQNGQIKSFTATITPASLAKLQAAATAPSSLPKTGEAAAPDYAWLIALGGLGSLTLAWALRRRLAH